MRIWIGSPIDSVGITGGGGGLVSIVLLLLVEDRKDRGA